MPHLIYKYTLIHFLLLKSLIHFWTYIAKSSPERNTLNVGIHKLHMT